MKKVAHTSEFLFGIYWWTWKTNNYSENCWSGPMKNKIILIFTTLRSSLKKIKKNTCRCHYQNFDKIYSSWDIEQNIPKLVILGHFLPFYPMNTPKIKILKNQKICWRYHHFTLSIVPEIWSETGRIFCHFGSFFALNDTKNQNFEKKWKKPADIILLCIHVYHKWRSHDIWFLQYRVWQTKFFCHFGSFFTLSAPWQPRKSKF